MVENVRAIPPPINILKVGEPKQALIAIPFHYLKLICLGKQTSFWLPGNPFLATTVLLTKSRMLVPHATVVRPIISFDK